MVKVNRTVVSDTSGDGNSFFFHSTSFNTFDQEETEEIDAEIPAEENEEIPFLDEAINEVPEDFGGVENNVGIDEGLA